MSSTERDSAKLRSFGLLVGGVFLAISAWPLLFGREVRLWAAVPGILLVLTGLAAPRLLAPVHRIWMTIGNALGAVNSRVIMGIVFYAIVTPIGILMRALGRDPIEKRFDSATPTYRIPKEPRAAKHMKHQF